MVKKVIHDPLFLAQKAAQLYGIGQHRLRKIISEDYECRYHLMIGRVIKIKKKAFEEFLDIVQEL